MLLLDSASCSRRFYAGDYASAVAAASKAAPLLWTAPSQFEMAEYHFYGALARAAGCDVLGAGSGARHLAALKAASQAQIALWAENCPENFRKPRRAGRRRDCPAGRRDLDAMRLYEEAIRSAREHGFVQNEGLANELAARFLRRARLRDDRRSLSAQCPRLLSPLGRGRQGPLSWSGPSATAPGLQRRRRRAARSERRSNTSISRRSSRSRRRSRARSTSRRLIDTLMMIALEHAGADRGLLILARRRAAGSKRRP